MAFDGITLNKIVNELQVLIGGKVNYIYEPDSNNIVMGLILILVLVIIELILQPSLRRIHL